MPPSPPAIALEPELVAFTEGGVSLHAASRDANNVAQLSRPLGCRISDDRTRVTVFLLASHSGAMLADYRANGQIAVVITLPSSHRTVQLKAAAATYRIATENDEPILAAYLASMEREVQRVGYPSRVTRAMLAHRIEDLVAVTFSPEQVFEQTPGPRAGKLVAGSA